MNEETFAREHAKICKTKGSPATKRSCGKKLFRFLTRNGLELDIFYNQKKHGSEKSDR